MSQRFEMRSAPLAKLLLVLAWLAIAAIAYATLTKVGFVYGIYYKLSPYLMHPGVQKYALVEHVAAFAVLGALFQFAYPSRTPLVCCIVLGAAVGLELMQHLTPDRHGTLLDAIEKIVGGALGIGFALTMLRLARGDSARST
jgi:VanZ family protein